MKYEKGQDFKPVEDLFEPISMPSADYLRLPHNIKIEFIDSEAAISQLDDLKGQRFIGVDAEWRPQVHRWQKENGPAILQLGGKNEAFLIDIIKLSKNKALDQKLTQLFTQKSTTVVGFGFQSDLSVFRKFCPQMKFIERIPKFVDAQEYFKAVYPDFKDKGGSSLARVCERTLDKKLCKREQISNWETRPLRYSQEHYAAMDAWVLVDVMSKLMDKGGDSHKVQKYTKLIGEKATKSE